jgi:hypothetical protein
MRPEAPGHDGGFAAEQAARDISPGNCGETLRRKDKVAVAQDQRIDPRQGRQRGCRVL